MSSERDEPELLEAHWNHDQIGALFEDLRAGAEVEHVQVKCSTGEADRSVSLDAAQRMFIQGDTKAIQIRYRFEHQIWCDTLMVLPDSVKIIRTRGTP